jgi:tRNA pseudouridine38-40 synthase
MPPVERLKITIAYDGRPFSGWQSQPSRNSVQDHLRHAFSEILSVPVNLHGAGRTDAGVHALGQVTHVDVPPKRMNPATWLTAVNARLPPEIRVIGCRSVSSNFHAQLSATGKTYRYRIWNAAILDPMEIGRSWHVPQPLDRNLIRDASRLLSGTHDFASFAANRGKGREPSVRTIHHIRVQHRKELVTLEFDGSGFLYRMVRMLTGTIVRVATGRADLDWIEALLANPGATKTNCTAPAHGLYLLKVKY